MSTALEKLLEEERLDSRKEVALKATKSLITGGKLSNEQIAYAVNIPLEEVNKIAEEL